MVQGEQVPASEKLVSLFEPHTASIRKGKAGKPVEFGRVLWLGEVEGGIITQAKVLDGNPDDTAQLVPSVECHIQQFGRPPNLLAGDGKFATPTNEQPAQQRGVKHVVLPRLGQKTPVPGIRAAALVSHGPGLVGGHRRTHERAQTPALSAGL